MIAQWVYHRSISWYSQIYLESDLLSTDSSNEIILIVELKKTSHDFVFQISLFSTRADIFAYLKTPLMY